MLVDIAHILASNALLARSALNFVIQPEARQSLSEVASVDLGLSGRFLDTARVGDNLEHIESTECVVELYEAFVRGDHGLALDKLIAAEVQAHSVITESLRPPDRNQDYDALLTFSLRMLDVNLRSLQTLRSGLGVGDEL